jgi:hypothetical protein
VGDGVGSKVDIELLVAVTVVVLTVSPVDLLVKSLSKASCVPMIALHR